MKIRTGFVSNSSSSSFTCSVCGETQSGWDLCLSDAGMFCCENGHYICNEHKLDLTDKQKQEIIERMAPKTQGEGLDDKWDNFCVDNYDDSPAEECPCCQMKEFDKEDLAAYFYKSRNLTKDDLANELKSKFKSYKEFVEYLK